MLTETSAKGAFKKRGFMGLLRYGCQRLTNMAMLEDQVSTLQYFTYEYFKQQGFTVQQIPKAEGPLRDLQVCDAVLLAIFDAACKKHQLAYWLDFGTLLGAVRHRGFIPWDDDTDVFMMRDEYEKALPMLRKELGQYGIDVSESALRMGIGYHNQETGIWIDVIAKDYASTDTTNPDEVAVFEKDFWKYRRGITGKVYSMSRKKEEKLRRKCMKEICNRDVARSVMDTLEWSDGKPILWKTSTVFPGKPVQFEGFTLMGPNDYDDYLVGLYGPDYMGFPTGGVMHHGGDQGQVSDWAAKHGVDMKEMKRELEEILGKIRKEVE